MSYYTIDGYYIQKQKSNKIVEKFKLPNIKPMLNGLKNDLSNALDKSITDTINYRLKNSIPIKSFDKNGIPIEISINDKNEVCIIKNSMMVCINESSFSTS
jgi:hypothetical protein